MNRGFYSFNKSKYVLVCLILTLCSVNVYSQNYIGHPDYFIYSYVDYINSNQIFHVEEGPRGLIYMANISGIQEYDGNEWVAEQHRTWS